MGPIVNEELTQFLFRPFQSSTTFRNLKQTGCGVFHVTDDVGLIARAAIGQLEQQPEYIETQVVPGKVLAHACRWYEFEVVNIDDSQPRSEIVTRLMHVGHIREFWGLNRAKHAILEAAILATRLHLLQRDEVHSQMLNLETIVDKTASPADRETFELLKRFISTE